MDYKNINEEKELKIEKKATGQKGKKKKKASKLRKTAGDIILVCLIAIMLFSGYKVFTIVKGYLSDRNSYKEVQDLTEEDFIDFYELGDINPDIIAWIRLDDTNIDYPIVHPENNSKYLTTLFDGTIGSAGTVFTDCRTEKPFKQFNTIVYGHNMKDKSMFHTLDYFVDEEYAEEHSYFKLYMPDGDYRMEVWAYVNMPADSDIYTPNVEEDERQKYLNMIKKNADYTMKGVSVGVDDTLVVLSTCGYEYTNARHIVVCKMVAEED